MISKFKILKIVLVNGFFYYKATFQGETEIYIM